MWNVLIESMIPQSDGSLGINVVFVDELAGRKEARNVRLQNPTTDSVYQALRSERARLAAVSDAVLKLPTGQFIDIDVPPTGESPTQEQIDYTAYQTAYNVLRLTKQQMADGIAAQSDVDAALGDLQKKMKPEYIGRF
jgi:hypothetical protein